MRAHPSNVITVNWICWKCEDYVDSYPIMPRAVIGILRHEPGQLGEGLTVHFQVSQDKPLKKCTTGQKPKNTLYVPPWKVSRIPKSEKFLLVKSGIKGFGIQLK